MHLGVGTGGGAGSERRPPPTALKGAIRFSHLGQKPHPEVFAKLATRSSSPTPGSR